MANLTKLIAPSFYNVHNSIKDNQYTHYWLKGGRGSTKSSFVSLEIILGMMKDPNANAVAMMKYKVNIREGVYEQLLWAIDMLGVSNYWVSTVSPMAITYKPTGQRIVFRGCDNPKRVKGAKLQKGYFKYIWYEELENFGGMEEVRTLNQTFLRGGDDFNVFYTYNPPKSARSWVNAETKSVRDDRLVHHSDYRAVPKQWLGEAFIIEAEHLKKTNENSYDHEYLGLEVGTGLEVFNNVVVRPITDTEIQNFDKLRHGIDWGFTTDPAVYEVMHYDKKHRTLYLIKEISGVGLSNRVLSEKIKQSGYSREQIIADSSEPKSISECKNEHGLNIIGAKKPSGSIEHGIKWLQDLDAIVIDSTRCPRAANEFTGYCMALNKQGEVMNKLPDKDNHTIDTVRYAMQDDMVDMGARWVTVR